MEPCDWLPCLSVKARAPPTRWAVKMALYFAGRSVRVHRHRNSGECIRKLAASACNPGSGSGLAAAGAGVGQGAGGGRRRRLLLSPPVAPRPGAQSRAAAGILEPTPRRGAAEQGSRLSEAVTALQLHRTQQTPGSVTFPLGRHLCPQSRELSNTDLYMMHVNGFINHGSCLSSRVLAPRLRNHKYLQGLWSFKPSIVTNGWASALDSHGHWHFVTMVHHQCRPYGYFRDGDRYPGRNNAVPLPRGSNTLYYDILKISPSATQSQIKSAYYKQSFRYHPDRNAGSEEAALRFTQINEAYSVLGSVTLRKKYDRGILTAADLRSGKKPLEKAQTSMSKQSQAWSSSEKLSSEKSRFNFDEFYKAHYGEQLAREQTQRWRRMQLRKNKESLEGRWHIQKLMEMTVTAMLIGGFFLLFSINNK